MHLLTFLILGMNVFMSMVVKNVGAVFSHWPFYRPTNSMWGQLCVDSQHWYCSMLSYCTCKQAEHEDARPVQLWFWHSFWMSESWVQVMKWRLTASRQQRTTERSQSAVMCSTTSPVQWTSLPKPIMATATSCNSSHNQFCASFWKQHMTYYS